MNSKTPRDRTSPRPPRGRKTPNWIAKAKKVFGTKEQPVSGSGPFALYTECQRPEFSLHASREAAEQAKGTVDSGGCGGHCPLATRSSNHRVVDLASPGYEGTCNGTAGGADAFELELVQGE